MSHEELVGRVDDEQATVIGAPSMGKDGAQQEREGASVLEIFDKPMCCSTGICGPFVDPALVQFAADLEWLRRQGVHVDRFNLSQQPSAFSEQEDVRAMLNSVGVTALPIIRVNGRIVSHGVYPPLGQLAAWTRIEANKPSNPDPLPILPSGCR
jgi:hypothetical protein